MAASSSKPSLRSSTVRSSDNNNHSNSNNKGESNNTNANDGNNHLPSRQKRPRLSQDAFPLEESKKPRLLSDLPPHPSPPPPPPPPPPSTYKVTTNRRTRQPLAIKEDDAETTKKSNGTQSHASGGIGKVALRPTANPTTTTRQYTGPNNRVGSPIVAAVAAEEKQRKGGLSKDSNATKGKGQGQGPVAETERRSLRSKDGGSRSRSELAQYFPNYEQMLSLEPAEPGE